jgi:hypothetical protein
LKTWPAIFGAETQSPNFVELRLIMRLIHLTKTQTRIDNWYVSNIS